MSDNETISQDYLDFVKLKKVKNLTRNQWQFGEFLLRNKRETARMGSYEHLFRMVRWYLKNDYDWNKEKEEKCQEQKKQDTQFTSREAT